MKKYFIETLIVTVVAILGVACSGNKEKTEQKKSDMQQKVEEFAEVELTADLSNLTEKERQMIAVFIDIADIMNDLFWKQAFGDKSVLDTISDKWTKKFAMINYGPWERLNDLKPFVSGYGEKPLGAQFYPPDMTKEEFEALNDTNKTSLYTVLVRDEAGKLKSVFYKDYYKDQLNKVYELVQKAIELAEDPGLKKYLELRLEALKTDDYLASDMAWMDMKDSKIDFVVGPVENYEDKLFGYKAAYEAFVLVKDIQWSNDLAKFTKMLPDLQKELPCDPKYKQEVPGTESDLNVYDAVYYAGDCNSGSKTIAINLPNDERVHLEKGTRRLQLKNAMKAKFDKIMIPIGDTILEKEQQKNLKFEAFFWNVTFHEVAHGLGIKNTVTGKGNIRQALQAQYSAWEEAKADILGLFMVENLIGKGEITNITVEEAYTTFIAGMLRSVRFGAASAHGQANTMCYNFFEEKGAFTRNADGKYHIDIEKAKQALRDWAAFVLQIEGEGDLATAISYNEKNGKINEKLQGDLDKINNAGIPRDIDFKQGKQILGIK
ncbi:MAG: Zn-dependent hydrolase, partial [Bacteroidales bacterium]|nr:Zn-dependent hydrolase [Bacteroidales bacterium]